MPDMHAHHDHAAEPGSPIGFTGERVLPDIPEWAWCFQAHLFGYEDLIRRVRPGLVGLDIGCGEGYGAARLAEHFSTIAACDVAADAVAHAAAKYKRRNLGFAVSDGTSLPYQSERFDVVCSLQVIEHFTGTDEHLREVSRVLKSDGIYYVTTPNIAKMGEAERDNPYHVRDFDTSDLRGSLLRHFEEVRMEGMFYVETSPRYQAMQRAEEREARLRPRVTGIEKAVKPLPGAIRSRLRPALRTLAGVKAWPLPEAETARNAITAEDFYAGEPAEESFCLIGIASRPKR